MSALYVIILIVGIVFCLVVIGRQLSRVGLNAIAFDPAILFSIYFGLVHFLVPLMKHLEGKYRYSIYYSPENQVIVAIVGLLAYGLAIVLLRMTVSAMRPKVSLNHTGCRHAVNSLLVTAYVCAFIGLFFAYLDFRSIASSFGGLENFLSDRLSANEDRSALRILANFGVIGPALAVYAQTKWKLSRRVMVLPIIALFVTLYYFYLLSSRNGILLATIIVGNSYILGTGATVRIRFKAIMAAMLAAAVVAAIGLSITNQRYSSQSAYAQARAEHPVYYMLDGAFGNAESMLWLNGTDFPLMWGKTYAATLTNFIPRAWWPDKPMGGGPALINLIRPGAYIVGGSNNNSLTTGLLIEGQMNFGLAGAFLAVIGWVAAIAVVLRKSFREINDPANIFRFIIVWILATSAVYSEFLGFVFRLIVIGALPWVMFRVFFLSLPRQKR